VTLTSSLGATSRTTWASCSAVMDRAGASVVDALLGILRLHATRARADIFAVDIFVGAVGLGVDGDRIALDHRQRQSRMTMPTVEPPT